MSAKTYGIVMRLVAVGLAALIASGIVLQLPLYVPLLAVTAALLLATVVRRFVREVMADERSRRIEEKAASMTYRIYTVAAAAFALVVLTLRAGLPSWCEVAGQTVAYAVCGLMLLHLAVSRYYNGRF
jgi:uncharacterized membrane protein